MRHTPLFKIIPAAAIIAAAALTGCSGDGAKTDAATTSANTTDEVRSADYESTLLTASRAYAFKMTGTDCYLTISTMAEWPRKIGEADITALTDTLCAAAFPKAGTKDIKKAVIASLADTAGIVTGPATIIEPDKVPATTTAGIAHTYIAREALTESYATFTVTKMTYAGGAHPMTSVTPVSYDLKAGKVVTPAYIFKPGSDQAIIGAITSNLAMNLGVDPTKLTQAGFNTDTLPMPRAMAIDPNGMIVFQYPQYEVAPYSMGIISVPVTPYQLREVMTPAGLSLFGLTAAS